MMRTLFTGMLLLAATLAVPFSSRSEAQPVATGIAYDSVSRFVNTDAASLQPGNFDSHFQTASQPTPEMMAAYKNGSAERHYIAGNKERIDFLALQKATILDCGARSITSLDLKAKTYSVASLDPPRTSSERGDANPRHTASGTTPTDDGSRVSVAYVNKALGPRTIGPDVTDGFSSDMTIVTTRPGGESAASTMSVVEYVSKAPRLSLICNSPNGSAAVPPIAGIGMTQYQMLQSAVFGSDPRVSVSSTGPPFPVLRLAIFEVTTTMSGGVAGLARSTLSIVTERGNVRSIRADDPIFSIPADFSLVS